MKRRALPRRGFQVPDGHYLLSHSVGCLPATARARLDAAMLRPWAESGSDAWPLWLTAVDGFRRSLAALLGGGADEYCPQPGVSAAVFKLISALPAAGRRVLLVSRHAFPSIGFALSGLEKLGYRARFVEGDPTDISAWDRAMDRDVAAAVVMHVHSNSGLVSPVAALTALARERGIFSIVDACQSAGIVEFDVGVTGAGAVVGSCVKWLCGGPGAGFLWVDPVWLERLEPPDRGWFSHADPFAMAIEEFRYAPDARRFWGGTPSIAPFALAGAGIDAIGEIGVAAIHAHNRMLIARLAEALGERWAAALDMKGKGGTLCLDLGPAASAAEQALRDAACRLDRRGDVLRLSFHIFNDMADAEAIARILGTFDPPPTSPALMPR
jgi:selenocysteine lyase/cysteine desulfurase